MSSGSCSKDKEDNIETTFLNFSKTLLKTFVLLTVITLSLAVKNKLLSEGGSLFYTALFVVITTVLFTIIGILDTYLYNNLIIGIGIALGLQIMNWTDMKTGSSS